MKILTWNIDCKSSQQKNWDYILNKVKPDIALLQECREIENFEKYPGNNNLIIDYIGGSRKWGSAIYTKGLDVEKVEIDTKYHGWVLGSKIILKYNLKFLVISVHTKLKGVSHVAPELKDLFQKIKALSNTYDHTIIGGDLNAARSYDNVYYSKKPEYKHEILFNRIESVWFNPCKVQFGKEIQTIWGNSKHPYQNDYIFFDKKLQNKQFNCKIPDFEEIKDLSDHSPVIVEVDI